jgi:hypothetical protein
MTAVVITATVKYSMYLVILNNDVLESKQLQVFVWMMDDSDVLDVSLNNEQVCVTVLLCITWHFQTLTILINTDGANELFFFFSLTCVRTSGHSECAVSVWVCRRAYTKMHVCSCACTSVRKIVPKACLCARACVGAGGGCVSVCACVCVCVYVRVCARAHVYIQRKIISRVVLAFWQII